MATANLTSPPSSFELQSTAGSPQTDSKSGYGSNDLNNNPLLEPYSTLDEPISETILRDCRAVGRNLRIVLLPLDQYSNLNPLSYMGLGGNDEESENDADMIQEGTNQHRIQTSLRDWDFWGPLFICLLTSVLLSMEAKPAQASSVFACIFVLVWVGAAIVTVNAQLLGGTISFFQSVCVFGYSVFPLTLSALLIAILRHTPLGWMWLDIVWVAIGYVWATRASTVFIGQYIVKERRFLAVFPVLFFYLFLAWMILLI